MLVNAPMMHRTFLKKPAFVANPVTHPSTVRAKKLVVVRRAVLVRTIVTSTAFNVATTVTVKVIANVVFVGRIYVRRIPGHLCAFRTKGNIGVIITDVNMRQNPLVIMLGIINGGVGTIRKRGIVAMQMRTVNVRSVFVMRHFVQRIQRINIRRLIPEEIWSLVHKHPVGLRRWIRRKMKFNVILISDRTVHSNIGCVLTPIQKIIVALTVKMHPNAMEIAVIIRVKTSVIRWMKKVFVVKN